MYAKNPFTGEIIIEIVRSLGAFGVGYVCGIKYWQRPTHIDWRLSDRVSKHRRLGSLPGRLSSRPESQGMYMLTGTWQQTVQANNSIQIGFTQD